MTTQPSTTCEACGTREADALTATGWRLCHQCFDPFPRDGHEESERLANERYARAMRRAAEGLEREGWL